MGIEYRIQDYTLVYDAGQKSAAASVQPPKSFRSTSGRGLWSLRAPLLPRNGHTKTDRQTGYIKNIQTIITTLLFRIRYDPPSSQSATTHALLSSEKFAIKWASFAKAPSLYERRALASSQYSSVLLCCWSTINNG